MREIIRAADILKSACGPLNAHLAEPVKQQKKKGPKDPKKSAAIRWLNTNLWAWCIENQLELNKEYEFAPGRKYASDYAIVSQKLLIEYEGGIFMERGGHNSHTGIQRDIDKYELAHKLGFTVIRLTAINYKTILQKLEQILNINTCS